MMVPAGMAGMLVGMMVPVIQRDIAEQDMLMIAGSARHVLNVRNHGGDARTREDKRQHDAKQRAQLSERQLVGCPHFGKFSRSPLAIATPSPGVTPVHIQFPRFNADLFPIWNLWSHHSGNNIIDRMSAIGAKQPWAE
jgi:hypothetical protein